MVVVSLQARRGRRVATSHAQRRSVRGVQATTYQPLPDPAASLDGEKLAAMLSSPPRWQLPKPAQREGGLWLLPPDTIAALRAAAPASAAAINDDDPFGLNYAVTSDGHRRLPTVDCTRPPGAPLPQKALELVSRNMCCILESARLWPPAEERWTDATYLRRGLQGASCNVLSAPADGRRFSYWFDHADRVQAGYEAKPLVKALTMSIDQYLRDAAVADSTRVLYLQQTLLQAKPDGTPGLAPCPGLGPEFSRDLEFGIDLASVKALVSAGRFGPWQRCQFFVGAPTTVGARSILHFDQYDNLFMQLSGTKTFRIFDPSQTSRLYPYPVHHPLDTRSQVDLTRPDYAAFPRLRDARSVTITLRAGQTLYLPAYWWHEVVTEPAPHGQLTCSVNFWFAATSKLLRPSLPLAPDMTVELSRQLEYLIADSLDDRARHVPAFFGMVSERTVELVAELRAMGILFVVVTAARKSTLHERMPLLPACDAAVCETGSRIYLTDMELDRVWPQRFEHICGPLERELDAQLRPEPLWQFFRLLGADVQGLKCDSRSYYGCFRVDTKGSAEVDEALRKCIAAELPAGVDWAMNLGKYDFFPAKSGKGNAVEYLQDKYGLSPEECVCLFDDDNDLPMARRCGVHYLPGLTSDSVRRAAMEHPSWRVASRAGQGVFAIEECLEELLERVKREAAEAAVPPTETTAMH